MRKFNFLILFLILTTIKSKSQDKYADHEIAPVISINSWKYTYASVGILFSGLTLADHYPNSYNLFLASEIKFSKNTTVGPKIGGWITYNYFATGGSLIYYMNGRQKSLVLRPEIGIERRRIKIVYGHNLKLDRGTLNDFNSHLIDLSFSLRRKAYFSHTLKQK